MLSYFDFISRDNTCQRFYINTHNNFIIPLI